MQAHEIMITNVYKVKEQDSVLSVIEKFIEHRISGLPIVNERNEIVAYISDGDIMRYIGKRKDIIVSSFYHMDVVKGNDNEFEDRVEQIQDLKVLSIAKKNVVTVPWNEEIEKVAAILGNKKIKKLPVERNGVLVGIISRGDVIRHTFNKFL